MSKPFTANEIKKWFAKHGMAELVNDVISRCRINAVKFTPLSASLRLGRGF